MRENIVVLYKTGCKDFCPCIGIVSLCEQFDVVYRIVNVCDYIYNFFRENEGIHNLNQIFRGICVPRNFESYRPRTLGLVPRLVPCYFNYSKQKKT